jgi:hypothetical protein
VASHNMVVTRGLIGILGDRFHSITLLFDILSDISQLHLHITHDNQAVPEFLLKRLHPKVKFFLIKKPATKTRAYLFNLDIARQGVAHCQELDWPRRRG